ncbi:hypothetical protein D3C84_1134920 [compost metagenome]
MPAVLSESKRKAFRCKADGYGFPVKVALLVPSVTVIFPSLGLPLKSYLWAPFPPGLFCTPLLSASIGSVPLVPFMVKPSPGAIVVLFPT